MAIAVHREIQSLLVPGKEVANGSQSLECGEIPRHRFSSPFSPPQVSEHHSMVVGTVTGGDGVATKEFHNKRKGNPPF